MPISNGNPPEQDMPSPFIYKDHPALKGVDLKRWGPMIPFKTVHRIICRDSVVIIWISMEGPWGKFLCSYN